MDKIEEDGSSILVSKSVLASHRRGQTLQNVSMLSIRVLTAKLQITPFSWTAVE